MIHFDKDKMDKRKAQASLEDYIFDMETRPTDRNMSETDIWTQLQQKEADILLAAELGKALLEKNQELAKQQEKLIEDYSAKLEGLEQEKHILRQKLALAEDESDQRIIELQADLKELKEKLETQETSIRQAEREKALLIDELTSQNSRLTAQIQEANSVELKLTTQLNQLKEQYNSRNSSLQEHVNSLEAIKDELRVVTEKRIELEKRLQNAQHEKDSLAAALEEASDRIHMLERHAREQETKFKGTLQSLDRLQRENNTLTERLESDDAFNTTTQSQGPKSLLHEMECDDEIPQDDQSSGKSNQIFTEARSVYKQLKCLFNSLKSTHDDDSGLHSDLSLESMDNTQSTLPSDSREDFRPGMLSAVSDDLTRLVLSLDAAHFKGMLDQTRNLVLEQEEEMKRNQEIIKSLETKLSVNEVELRSACEERDQARNDISQSNSAQDELVAQARQDRDTAVARRTKAEVDLAKIRVELMQANSQLLEAIQQKVELSQQLEQWQMDMQELIEEQMKSKLSATKRKIPSAPPLEKKSSSYRLWRLFQR